MGADMTDQERLDRIGEIEDAIIFLRAGLNEDGTTPKKTAKKEDPS